MIENLPLIESSVNVKFESNLIDISWSIDFKEIIVIYLLSFFSDYLYYWDL